MEIPLAALGLSRLCQRDHAGRPRIEVFHEPFDRAAFAGCIPAPEQDHMLRTRPLRPILKLQQLDLKGVFLVLIPVPVHPILIRIIGSPGLNRIPVGINQVRVRAVLVVADCASVAADVLQVFPEVRGSRYCCSSLKGSHMYGLSLFIM